MAVYRSQKQSKKLSPPEQCIEKAISLAKTETEKMTISAFVDKLLSGSKV